MAGRLPDAVLEGVVLVAVVAPGVEVAATLCSTDLVAVTVVVTVVTAAVGAGTGASAITLASWLVRLEVVTGVGVDTGAGVRVAVVVLVRAAMVAAAVVTLTVAAEVDCTTRLNVDWGVETGVVGDDSTAAVPATTIFEYLLG